MNEIKICGNPDCRAENKATNNFCSTCGSPLPTEAASSIKLAKTSAEAPKTASRLEKKHQHALKKWGHQVIRNHRKGHSS